MLAQLPNLISILRLLLVPWFALLLLEEKFVLALGLFVLMGISDGLDGYLARALDAKSSLGEALDPLADKVMLTAALVIMGHMELMPMWLAVLAVSRDFLIIGGALVCYLFWRTKVLTVLTVGKINTFLQIVLVLALLGQQLVPLPVLLIDVLIWSVAAIALVSGLWYALVWFKQLQRNGDAAR